MSSSIQATQAYLHRAARAGRGLAITALVLGTASAYAQLTALQSTAGFKGACENSIGNRVVVSQDTTVSVGYPASYPEQVATPCTVQLLNGAKLAFDKVGMQFAGGLTIVGGSKSALELLEARLMAPAVNVQLTGDENSLRMSFSRIDASAGSFNLTLGRTAKMELLRYRSDVMPYFRGTLVASGALTINAGERLSASLNEIVFIAGNEVTLNANGAESEIKLENSGLRSFNTHVTVLMRGSKSKAEFSNSGLLAAGNIDVAMGQTESGLSLSNVNVEAGARAQIYAAGAKSEVSVSNGRLTTRGGLFVSAAAGSTEGSLKVEGATVNAGTPIRFVSGVGGKTAVNQNSIVGTGLLDIASAGACEALGNRITAPQQQICN
jgi:hypothetical protein